MTDHDLQPGPELDRLVAEKVMGWAVTRPVPAVPKYIQFQTGPSVGGFRAPTREQAGWNPSTNIAHAWEVVEKLHPLGFYLGSGIEHRYIANFDGAPVNDVSNSAPHAICLAALKAVGAHP